MTSGTGSRSPSGRSRRPLPLGPARDHPRLRLQHLEHPELADPGLHLAVVPGRVARPRRSLGAAALAQMRAGRDGHRARARDDGRRRRPRFRFFGREALSFLLVLPIALPGVITGIALNSFYAFWGVQFSFWTIVIGHATFCVVIVYNNAVARMRRTSPSLVEASMDLGADAFQTFRWVILPVLSTALVSGGAARLRALLRRSDRHPLHRRCPEHAADLDPRQDPARAAAPRGERRRLRRHRADGDPGRDLAASCSRVRATQ